MSALFANAAAAQPVVAVSPDNFTADPLFQQFVGDMHQISGALHANMAKMMTSSIPSEAKAAAAALPACMDEVSKVMGESAFITPLMSKLQSLGPDERKQFAAFVQSLHSPDGARVIALNRQAMAVSNQPDVNGMPQFVSEHDSEEIRTLLQSQPAPNELSQAVFGLSIYMRASAIVVTDDCAPTICAFVSRTWPTTSSPISAKSDSVGL
ncbi:hypothetical protein WSK_1952 [Novosphingobium sp. Rr 2-17]|uniref:hypothetical protein n=1 Tax=Novosphingobium sp. Rr 2-17 TaxID=555793 RepID=UPI00026981D8|nr:hypothetical protein [Novosphingobium sp. Rr 2-17]EIZ79462.1 hypothetical protein WSK_1952 [Novosphingobium sp. Rr 2-17]